MTSNKDTRWSTATNDASRRPRRDESSSELDNDGPKLYYTPKNDKENVGGTSEPGRRELGRNHPHVTPRGRPGSAPQKTYPYACSLRTPNKQAGAESSPKIGNGVASEPSRRGHDSGPPRAAAKVEAGARGGCGARVRTRGASKTNLKTRQAKVRSSSSIGAGSSGRGKGHQHAVFERKESGGGCIDEEISSEEVPLSSQEFGLRRWKEYAVLRYVELPYIALPYTYDRAEMEGLII